MSRLYPNLNDKMHEILQEFTRIAALHHPDDVTGAIYAHQDIPNEDEGDWEKALLQGLRHAVDDAHAAHQGKRTLRILYGDGGQSITFTWHSDDGFKGDGREALERAVERAIEPDPA